MRRLNIYKRGNKVIKTIIVWVAIVIPWSLFASEIQFDKYGGWKGLKGEKTEWFHTEQINGRWWIVTPEGNVFWSIGMYCVRISGIPETGSNKRTYRDACFEKYGSEKEWARVTKIQLKEWGFNTIGDWSSETIYRTPGIAYVIGIDLPRKAQNVIREGHYGYFPDVFSQEFRDSIRSSIEERFRLQPYLAEDKWLLGYFLADEPSWYGSKQRRGSLVDDFINLGSDKSGKKAWVEFIKSTYSDVRDLNSSWGTNFGNMDELLFVKKIEDNENSKKDKLAFLEVVAEEFSKVLAQNLREFDKNHMILGTRPSRHYPEIIKGISKYTDVYSTSHFNQGYDIDPRFFEGVDTIYKYSGKPIMPTVLISAQDAGLPYGIVRTQRDRGISYWRYLADVASDPRIVGAHWFQYFDPPLKCYDPQAANWGLVNDKDEPYEDAVNLIIQANKLVYAYGSNLSDFAPEFDSMFGLKKSETPEISEESTRTIIIPIADAGFEQGRRYWGLQAWQGKSKASIDSSIVRSGEKSLKIQGGPDQGWDSVGVGILYKPDFILKPGYKYKLSGWIKTQNVENLAFVRIKVKYRNGESGYFGTEGLYGTMDWKYGEIEFSPRDENEVEYLAVQLVGKGVAWFDDIKLEVMVPEDVSSDDFVSQKSEISEEKISFQKTRVIEFSNAGFEEGKKDWVLQSWKGRPRIVIDTRIAHLGKRSVKIRGSGQGWDSVGVAMKGNVDFIFNPVKRYRLSGWVKTQDVEEGAFIRIKVQYEDGKIDYFQTNSLTGSGEWEKVSKEFRPRAVNKIDYLACQLVGRGVAWFDDISIEEIGE